MRRREWIEGVVATLEGETLVAPISGSDCVYFELWAYGVLSGQSLDKRACDFVLERGSDEVVVRTGSLELDRECLPSEAVWTNRSEDFEALRDLLGRYGLEGRHWYDARVLQVVESIVPLGTSVAIWGSIRAVADPEGGRASYRRPPRRPALHARRLRLTQSLQASPPPTRG